MTRGLTVAIVTARHEEEIRYPAWGELAREALRGNLRDPFLSGEWLALCVALRLFPAVQHHVFHQLRALALQTRLPDRVLVVDRTLGSKCHSWPEMERALDEEDYPFPVMWTQPQVGPDELGAHPHLAFHNAFCTAPPPSFTPLPERDRSFPRGNADKNTALVLCQTDWLMMLDDSILPGFTLCERAARACEQDTVLMIGHRALFLPTKARDYIEAADSNWNNSQDGRAFGIWAMPLRHVLKVNGFNTTLDGRRGAWDTELQRRMRTYANNVNIAFVTDPAARCYEIEHDYPWTQPARQLDEMGETGSWSAPGPSLKKMRDAFIRDLQRGNYAAEEENDDAQDEAFDEED